jgi:hypothetical protein
MAGALGKVNDFKQQHPRRFIGVLVACVVIPLLLLGGSRSPDGLRSYAYPASTDPSASPSFSQLAIAPASIKAATERSEQLWQHNLEKRRDFIKEKGGINSIRMFSPKEQGGWGQLYTVWVRALL